MSTNARWSADGGSAASAQENPPASKPTTIAAGTPSRERNGIGPSARARVPSAPLAARCAGRPRFSYPSAAPPDPPASAVAACRAWRSPCTGTRAAPPRPRGAGAGTFGGGGGGGGGLVPDHRGPGDEIAGLDRLHFAADEAVAASAQDQHGVHVLVPLECRKAAGRHLEIAQLRVHLRIGEQHLPGDGLEQGAVVFLVRKLVHPVPAVILRLAVDRSVVGRHDLNSFARSRAATRTHVPVPWRQTRRSLR